MSEEVKKKQVRPRRSEQMRPHLEKGEVGKYLSHALAGFDLPPLILRILSKSKNAVGGIFSTALTMMCDLRLPVFQMPWVSVDGHSIGGASAARGGKRTLSIFSGLEISWKR